MKETLIYIFWISVFIVFYTYIGYGILLYILVMIKEHSKKHKKESSDNSPYTPRVTLLIAAYNEEKVIDEKMENSLSLDYPAELLEIVWVTDGSTDKTNEYIEKYTAHSDADRKPSVKILFHHERKGKSDAINRAMYFIHSPIVVLTDVNAIINSQAIRCIVDEFRNPKVGCVSGEKKVISDMQDNPVSSEGAYWKYESFLKKLDYRLYSAIGAAGELFAIRRELFEEIPQDTILDDFIISMKTTLKGYVIAYNDKAYAIEKASLNIEEERKRKVRIAAGGVQSVCRLTPLLNIFKYKTLSFQYISHRVLRWSITPILLFLLLPLNIVIAFIDGISVFYTIILAFQIIFYFLGITKISHIPYYFLFMNINVIKGFFYLGSKKGKKAVWEKALRQ